MFVLKVGTKMYYGKGDDGLVKLYYDSNDKHVEKWADELKALQDGKRIFHDQDCNKFSVVKWTKPRRRRRSKKVIEKEKAAEEGASEDE